MFSGKIIISRSAETIFSETNLSEINSLRGFNS